MLEPQIDNSNLPQGDNPGTDELAKLQAQLSASSSEAKLVNEVNKVLISDDFSYFQELNKKDNRMGERVVEKIAKLRGLDVEEVRNLLMENAKTPEIDIEQKVNETLAKKEGQKALEEFIKKAGLDKDKELNEEFMSNFEDYMQGKEFNEQNVKKFSKSAYRDLNEDKVKSFENKKGEIEAQILSGGAGKDKETKPTGRQLLTNRVQNDW